MAGLAPDEMQGFSKECFSGHQRFFIFFGGGRVYNIGDMYIPNESGAANGRGVGKGDGDMKALWEDFLESWAIHAHPSK